MDLDAALREHFGFPAFRPGQREACAAALAGRDVLVVMPTGAGKSLCYQLPALVRDDLTIVVSPLVSLMADQVGALERAAPGRAALVNAQQDLDANRDGIDRAVSGERRLLYVAPERFASPGFVERISQARLGLFVVDEAHCVSQWGHDFRPDYFRLGDAARYLGADAIVASTATATPQVAADVAVRLGLRDPVQVSTGFDRPALSFGVIPCRTAADRDQRVAAALAEPGALPAIVYAGTRKATDALARDLSAALGVEAVAYHAGLGREDRADAQRRFMAGEVPLVVATNAFGMGVDKADVRTVCHAAVPGSLEAYYQEAGRAGRDGRPARALLFSQPKDKGLHVFFIERAAVDDAAFAQVARALERHADAGGRYDLDVRALTGVVGGEEDAARAVIGYLARAGVVRPSPSPVDRVAGRLTGPCDGRAIAACRTAARDVERARWKQYRTMWAYVEQPACRRRAILRHFGDPAEPAPTVPCCDVCDPSVLPAEPPQRAAAPGRGRAGRSGAGRTRGGTGAGPRTVQLDPGELDAAILEVVASARPGVGRTRAVEILRGGRSKVIAEHSYDGLPPYGAFAHLTREEVLGRVDELLDEGALRSTGGRFPKLTAA